MLARNLWHKSLTAAVISEALERSVGGLDNPGFCLECGREADGCEPDARAVFCENCGAEQVFGAGALAIAIM
jgi:hypothetical protein